MIKPFNKFLHSIYVANAAFLIFYTGSLFADELGRLFTTVDERAMLDNLRKDKPVEIKIIDISIEDTQSVEEQTAEIGGGITVNGFVYRKGGKSTAWINQGNTYQGDLGSQYFHVDADDIDSENVQVELPASVTKITLKAGQTYDPATAEVIDLTDNYRE